MFKYKSSIAILGLCISCSTNATSNLDSVKEEVLSSFDRLVDASKKLDIDAYFQHIDSEKFIGLNSNGTNWNSFDELAFTIKPGFEVVQEVIHLEFPNVKVSVIDHNTAILVNEFSQTIRLKNGKIVSLAGGGTQVWSKCSGNWKLVSISASNK